MQFFFTGASAFVWDSPYKFETFGQLAEMDEAFAQARCLDGLQIIPASHPAAQAFSADELKRYPARHHPDAPPAFTAKVRDADAALEEYRQLLRNPKVAKETDDAHAE